MAYVKLYLIEYFKMDILKILTAENYEIFTQNLTY